jgi:nucleotide-binding universal stress UspA family protein
MKCSILLAFNDSASSNAALDYLLRISACPEQSAITLLHIFRKPTGSEEMMGKKFMQTAPTRIREAMAKARQQLIAAGFPPDRVLLALIDTPYPTVADGIIDQVQKGNYHLVVLGRKRMSKAEEFVLGDTSIRLVRALEGTAVLVVKQ